MSNITANIIDAIIPTPVGAAEDMPAEEGISS